jgi:hypothetical protein
MKCKKATAAVDWASPSTLLAVILIIILAIALFVVILRFKRGLAP